MRFHGFVRYFMYIHLTVIQYMCRGGSKDSTDAGQTMRMEMRSSGCFPDGYCNIR